MEENEEPATCTADGSYDPHGHQQSSPGAKLMVLSDGENILLKPIKKPDISEFRAMMNEAAKWADEVGMKEDDITEAIATVRKRRKAATV